MAALRVTGRGWEPVNVAQILTLTLPVPAIYLLLFLLARIEERLLRNAENPPAVPRAFAPGTPAASPSATPVHPRGAGDGSQDDPVLVDGT